jgi:Secretion system C-terminal sorting domain
MKMYIIIVMSFLSIFKSNSQTYFSKIYAKSYPFFGLISGITTTKDNGYIFVQRVKNIKIDSNLIYITKINVSGDTIWSKQYGTDKKNVTYSSTKIRSTYDGSFIVTGACYEKDSVAYSGYLFILKIDSNGKLLWLKSYSDGVRDCTGLNIIQLKDSNFVACGYSQSFNIETQEFKDWNSFIVKIDVNGNTIWKKTIGLAAYHEVLVGISETNEQDLIFVGRKFNDEDFNSYALKLSKNGNLIWDKTFGGLDFNEAYLNITRTHTNDFVLCGIENPHNSNIISKAKGILAKINKDGNLIWDKRYAQEVSNLAYNNVEELSNHTIVAVGTQDYKPNTIGITKFTSDGSVIWHRNFDYNKEVNRSEQVSDLALTIDNGFILAGSAFPLNTNSSQGWLLKLDSLGCDHEGCATPTSTGEVEDGKRMFSIAPNPADESVMITIGKEIETGETTVRILDLQGRLVKKSTFLSENSHSIILNINDLSNGVFFINVSNKTQSATQKLIVNH